MPVGAALPAIFAGLGAGASAVGAGLNAASAGSTKLVQLPPPASLFPGIQGAFLNQLAGSGGAGPTAMNTMQNMAATGMPTDVGPAWNAMVAAQQPMLAQQNANILTQFGQEGLRYSTPAINAEGNFQSQTMAQNFAMLAQMQQAAQEAARQRQLSASSFLTNMYSQPAEAMYPTATVVGGGPSVAGSVTGSIGNSLQAFALMAQLGLFGGGSGSGGGNPYAT